MKTGANFEETTDAAADFRPAGGGLRDARKNLQQRRLARAVAANQAEDFAFANFQRNVFQRPEGFLFLALENGKRRLKYAAKRITQKAVRLNDAATVAFA